MRMMFSRADEKHEKMFLSSSFNDVAKLFADFANGDLEGKSVTFIPTAGIPEKVTFYVEAGKKALEKRGLEVDEPEISTAAPEEIAGRLRKNDYIYISGGNTFFLLQELKRTGADKIIVDEVSKGKAYIGESAGAIIASPNVECAKDPDDRGKAPDLNSFDALNLPDFCPLPHHTNFPFKKAVEKMISKYAGELKLYPISNSQAILVEGADVNVRSE